MKKIVCIGFFAAALVLGIVIITSGPANLTGGLPSTMIIRKTTNLSGSRQVSLCFSNPTSTDVAVQIHSIDYEMAGRWVKAQPVPAGLAPGLPTVVAAHQRFVTDVKSPTNAPWKLRVLCVKRRATDMVADRLVGFFRPSRAANFRGESYLIETEIAH